MVIKRRPHTVTLHWRTGTTLVNGRLSGGVDHSATVPCRIEESVGKTIDIDGVKVALTYELFTDTINLTGVDPKSLTVLLNGVKHKVLRVIPWQSHSEICI
jgi:hypothetical protein